MLTERYHRLPSAPRVGAWLTLDQQGQRNHRGNSVIVPHSSLTPRHDSSAAEIGKNKEPCRKLCPGRESRLDFADRVICRSGRATQNDHPAPQTAFLDYQAAGLDLRPEMLPVRFTLPFRPWGIATLISSAMPPSSSSASFSSRSVCSRRFAASLSPSRLA
jgi:hypothetical protein